MTHKSYCSYWTLSKIKNCSQRDGVECKKCHVGHFAQIGFIWWASNMTCIQRKPSGTIRQLGNQEVVSSTRFIIYLKWTCPSDEFKSDIGEMVESSSCSLTGTIDGWVDVNSIRKSSARTIKKPRTQLKPDQRQPICVLGCNQSFVVWSWSWSWLPGFWGDTGPVATSFVGCTATLPYREGGPYVCGNLQVYTNHFGGHTTYISKKFNFYQLI